MKLRSKIKMQNISKITWFKCEKVAKVEHSPRDLNDRHASEKTKNLIKLGL